MKCNFKCFLSLALVLMLVLCSVPLQVLAIGENLPDAKVEVMEPLTLAADEYRVWDGSLSEGDKDRPLQAVMNFKALDTLEEAQSGDYGDWICDFYLTFDGMAGDSVSGVGSYLAGNYGDYGWIVIPTDTLTVEKGVEYPVVSGYDDKLTYENICDYVKDFTAALYINPETLFANPDMTVTLQLKMTNPDNPDDYLVIGEPAVYTVPELYGEHLPDAKVEVVDPSTLKADEYRVWNGSLSEGDKDRPLQAVMNFEALDTFEEAKFGGYGDWACDFYLTFDGMKGDSISGDGSYLAGNYGDYGWIVIPTDGMTVEEGVEYPVVSDYDANLTYENICDYVKEFTAALYVSPETLLANPDMTVTLKLKMISPDNSEILTIGEPAVYTVPELYGDHWPEAEVTVMEPSTLTAGEYRVWNGSNLTEGDKDRPLQAVMNFEALDTLEEARIGGFGDWICDFYLTFDGMKGDSISGDGSYLAGNYGDYGWIVIPTDDMTVEEGKRYPVVSNYDNNLTYENICDYVQEFTAALYVNPKTLIDNPDFTVTLSLQMTNPKDSDNIITIDGESVYTADELLAACGYVAQNTTTNNLYTDVNDANGEANEGETVILLTDVEVKMLTVFETFDLNGYTLTANYVTCFGNIVDNSDSNSGLLKVATEKFFAQADNAQLPVNTPDGYRFVEVVGFNHLYLDATQKYVCQPLFEEYAHDLLLAGNDVSGVDIRINVSWENSKGEPRSQSFTYNSEEFLQGYLNSYNPSTGKYGKMFTLKLCDITKDLTYQVQVVSDNGVILASGSDFVEKPEEITTTENITINTNAGANQASAFVPQGTKLSSSSATDNLKLTVSDLNNSQSNITLSENEVQKSVDVHIDGVSGSNTVPMIITITEFAEKGLNEGNLKLYHVEKGETVAMTQVFTQEEADAHNEFYYDPATGDVTMALATFSEITAVLDTENAWNGKFDYKWYDADKTELNIANADQLAGFSAIVGGMVGRDQDSFDGKTVKLLSDINLGDDEENNNTALIFYPIGYYNSEKTYEKSNEEITSGFKDFRGIFDGNGHTISNFYQNTWEMKGDNTYYPAENQYYRDGMGLFGRVCGGTVKNLTVNNFSSDGEYTTTGVIAAYADSANGKSATFENISIINCNPRVYNIGNGGIVGCVGWYSKDDTGVVNTPIIFKNITVDQSNKISALWGSYDVSCGGIVGQYYPDSNCGINFEKCHVAAVMDVYNDVCANYQYYWYRYCGMLIGTVRKNTTEGNYTVADTTGITATACTYTLGDWNEYWYCELVKNSLASYTHDHQFSRLTKIADENEIKDENGKWTREGNFVIPADDGSAVCYHIFKKSDGTLYRHFHNKSDESNSNIYEDFDLNGDGELNDLKEDRTCYFMPFNQVLNGLGYGVKAHYEFPGMPERADGLAKSEEKFSARGTITEYKPGDTIKLGDLFYAKEGSELSESTIYAFVSPATEGGNVSATYTLNTDNWENSTLKFAEDCEGTAMIIITDYYYCERTVIYLEAEESAEKFVKKFNKEFLYRVGNKNAVNLSSLFSAFEGAEIGDVTVTVEGVKGTGVSGTFISNNSNWENSTIEFSGTGVVKVTIKDDDAYCTPTELYLEVVDATNITSAAGTTTGGDRVLLCDVNTSSYVNYWNCTLWGNGFTYSLNGAPTAYNSKQGHGILITKNATLDNLVIVGDVYNSYGAYTNQDYYNAAVDVVGDTIIQNCYISGCSAPVSTRANATITNTTLYGGTVANLIIKSGTVTLENVTTANYADGRELVGMGIVVHSDATESAKLVLKGTLKQYNFICENKVPTDTYAKELHNAMFSDSCSKYHFDESTGRHVNTGIVSLTSKFDEGDITDNAKTGYVGAQVSVSGVKGYVYTQPNTLGSVNNNYDKDKDPHVATTQGTVPPAYSFDYTVKNYKAKLDGSNDYCYEENGKVSISMDEGDTFNWDTSILTVSKAGKKLEYTVEMNGTDYTGKSIAFNTAGEYEVVYTYTDPNNFILNSDGNITTGDEKTYTKTVKISVAVVEADTKHAEFTFGSSDTASTTVTIGNNTYVMPAVSATSSTIGSTTVDGKTIYYPIVEIVMSDGKTSHTSGWYAYFPVFSGAVTITDYKDNGTGDAETFDGSTQSMPSGLSVVGDPAQLFKYQSSSTAGTSPVVKNTILVYSSPSISAKRDEYSTVIQYSYQDNAGSTYYYYIGYHAPAQSYTSCFTPDTLITLADGSQKRIDELTFDDQVLTWDFMTGKYVSQDIALLVNHGEGVYRVANLQFSDGTLLRLIADHGVFDYDLNQYVYINADNMHNYAGHRFVQYDPNGGYNIVTLEKVFETEEVTEAYSITSAQSMNVFASNILTVAPPEDFYNWIPMGDKLRYDTDALEADIEQYGLYDYEVFADYVTYEQFVAWNGAYLKIPVEKGLFTFEYVLELIKQYKPYMNP